MAIMAVLNPGDQEVAVRLCLSRHTVHDHVKVLYRRAGVASRAEFMARCGGA